MGVGRLVCSRRGSTVRADQEIICVCEPDLEPDRGAGVAEVMRGSTGRWVKMISGEQPPANQTH